VLADFSGAVFGAIRVGPEALVALTDLEPGKAAEGTHPSGAVVKATLSRDAAGKWRAAVDLSYDAARIQPGDLSGSYPQGPARRGTGAGFNNNLINGLRVTDAAGNTLGLVTTGIAHRARGNTTWASIGYTFELTRPDAATGDPAAVTFWASYPKPVEVPFALAGVPVVGGKR
jgi:hypothetical protein